MRRGDKELEKRAGKERRLLTSTLRRSKQPTEETRGVLGSLG